MGPVKKRRQKSHTDFCISIYIAGNEKKRELVFAINATSLVVAYYCGLCWYDFRSKENPLRHSVVVVGTFLCATTYLCSRSRHNSSFLDGAQWQILAIFWASKLVNIYFGAKKYVCIFFISHLVLVCSRFGTEDLLMLVFSTTELLLGIMMPRCT